MNRSALQMQAPETLARHRGDPQVFPATAHALRSEKWLVPRNAAIVRKLFRSIAGDGLDSPRCRVDASDAMICQVGDIEVVSGIEREAMRLTQPRLPGRPA